MRQIEKNMEDLWEEIEKICNHPLTRSDIKDLSMYAEAFELLSMFSGKSQEEKSKKPYQPHEEHSYYHADKSAHVMPLNRQTADAWFRGMENDDGTVGGHWTMEQTNQVRAQRGIECDPLQFWIAINMIYSDYCKVFRKYGVGEKVELYADMAKAFLDDKDAMPDKLARYYEYIVEK